MPKVSTSSSSSELYNEMIALCRVNGTVRRLYIRVEWISEMRGQGTSGCEWRMAFSNSSKVKVDKCNGCLYKVSERAIHCKGDDGHTPIYDQKVPGHKKCFVCFVICTEWHRSATGCGFPHLHTSPLLLVSNLNIQVFRWVSHGLFLLFLCGQPLGLLFSFLQQFRFLLFLLFTPFCMTRLNIMIQTR